VRISIALSHAIAAAISQPTMSYAVISQVPWRIVCCVLQVWDLAKGFSKRGLLYPKMPTALTFSADGQTIITGVAYVGLCSGSKVGSMQVASSTQTRQMLCITWLRAGAGMGLGDVLSSVCSNVESY
jgi:hypothetical protein